jgi:hypothetical protein
VPVVEPAAQANRGNRGDDAQAPAAQEPSEPKRTPVQRQATDRSVGRQGKTVKPGDSAPKQGKNEPRPPGEDAAKPDDKCAFGGAHADACKPTKTNDEN